MSKVTIKFWNKNRGGYAEENLAENLLVNHLGEAVVDTEDGLAYAIYDFEPHFFVNGERIA